MPPAIGAAPVCPGFHFCALFDQNDAVNQLIDHPIQISSTICSGRTITLC